MGQPRGFSPTEFMSSIEEMGGLSKRNKYTISITPPNSLSSSVGSGKIDFLALSVLMPSKQFSTTEQRVYGINKTVPYETTYEPILLTMLNPQDWSTRIFWDEWLDHVQSPGSKNMRYYKSMIGQVEISHYHEEETTLNPSNAAYTCVLTEAWPERISAYAMGYENNDFGNFEISIRYKQWHEKGTRKQQPGFGGNLATNNVVNAETTFGPH
jgi:hypothetical protein|tara:strand:- start:55 stop:690 length:636 start_codon:yes stop_codon:yes gene_type:complete